MIQPLLNVFDFYETSYSVNWKKIERWTFISFLSDQTERSQPADACMSIDSESGVGVKN